MFIVLSVCAVLSLVTLIKISEDSQKMDKIILTEQYLEDTYNHAIGSIQNLQFLVLIIIIMIIVLIIMCISLATKQRVAKAEMKALKKQIETLQK